MKLHVTTPAAWNSEPVMVPTTQPEVAGSSRVTSERNVHKERFNVASEQEWHELIRDLAALANSGGGRIIVHGEIEKAEFLDRMARETDSTFADVSFESASQSDGPAVAIAVGPATFPLAFPAGSFYFRHGERSEPGTTADMRSFFERVLRRVRRRWLRGIRRVLDAPLAGKTPQQIASKWDKRELANLQPVRIVTDPDAPALQPQDVDRLYPWRQKDLLRELNRRLGRRALNSYDIQAVRRQHRLDERADFGFHLHDAGRRYSPAVADWIMNQYGRDPDFFKQARAADQETLRLRRQKPR